MKRLVLITLQLELNSVHVFTPCVPATGDPGSSGPEIK